MKNILVILTIIFSSYIVFFTDDVPSKKFTDEIESENSDIKVYIRGLDHFERVDLDIIKSIIEKKYGLICKIESSVITSYKDDNNKDCDLLQEELGLTNTFTRSFGKSFGWVYDESEPITIYNTNSKLSERKIGEVVGLCYGNSIYISSPTYFSSFFKKSYIEMTAIHELSHSFGMDHCNDSKCVMNGYFDADGNILFCERHMKEALENGFKPNGY
jgi:hypothetical protein